MKVLRVGMIGFFLLFVFYLVKCTGPIGIDSPHRPTMERIVSVWLKADETLPEDLDLSGVNLDLYLCAASAEGDNPELGEYVSSNFTNEAGMADFWHPEEAFFVRLDEETLPDGVAVRGENILAVSFDMTEVAFYLTADTEAQF